MRNILLISDIRKFIKYITLVYNQNTMIKLKIVFRVIIKKDKNLKR